MKRLIYILFIGLFVAGCAEQYKIAGNTNLPLMDGKMLYLRVDQCGNKRNIYVDSCQVIHGRFIFNGCIDTAQMAQLYIGNESVMPIVLENGKMTMFFDNIEQKVIGGRLNSTLYKFINCKRKYENKIWDIQQASIRMMQKGCPMEIIQKKYGGKITDLNNKIENLETKFIIKNSDNILGPGVFYLLCKQFTIPVITPQIRQILRKASPKFLQNQYVRNYIKIANNNPISIPLDDYSDKPLFYFSTGVIPH